jgi:hypothetical protein
MGRDEIYRRAVAAGAPAEMVTVLDALPEGDYAQDEIVEALDQIGGPDGSAQPAAGVPGAQLGDEDLLREMGELHRTRDDTLRHGSDQALAHHDERLAELESEYRRRFPDREVDPQRLRSGARQREPRIRPVEETPQVARAVADDTPVAALADQADVPPDPNTPVFSGPSISPSQGPTGA